MPAVESKKTTRQSAKAAWKNVDSTAGMDLSMKQRKLSQKKIEEEEANSKECLNCGS
jgi:hypothetical protein